MTRRWVIFVGCLALGCGAPAAAVTPRSSPTTVTLEVAASPPAEGKIAWAWLPEELFGALQTGQLDDAQLFSIVLAFEATDALQLGERPQAVAEVDAAGAGGFVAVLQAPRGNFWSAVGGDPRAPNRMAVSELIRPMSADPVTVRLDLAPPPTRESPEPCSGPGRELVVLEVPEVEGEIGNDTSRRLCVMLPADYASSAPRRYPVVYLLPGLGGSDTVYLHLTESDPAAILVGVDGRTAYGASYFHDTAYAGAWEGFLEGVVAEIDRRYRTVADPRRRGLLGHSTGGYNAISLALRRTDLFMAAAASSPDGLDFEAWLFDGPTARPDWLRVARLEDALDTPGQMVSYAVQLDDASHPGALVWPFDLETGARDDAVWARWSASTPAGLLADPAVAHRARQNLDDRLFIAVGRRDAFRLFAPAEAFHRRLAELEIRHAWAPDDGTHFDDSAARRTAGLAYLLERF